MPHIPVFAGLGSDILFSNSVLEQASRDVKISEGQSLLQACHKIFIEEIAVGHEEDAWCGVDANDFNQAESLLRPLKSYHTNAAVQHSFLCLAQLLRYMRVDTSFTSKPLATAGFCAGLFSAVAAATSISTLQFLFRAQECYRAAVKVGVASEIFRRSISPIATDHPWSLVVDGLTLSEAQKLLDMTNNSELSIPLFISSHNSKKCVTISGEGQILHRRIKSILPGQCRTRRTNVFSLYHDRQILSEVSEKVLKDMKNGNFSFPNFTDLVCPLFCTTDGSKITSDDVSPPDHLVKSIIEMIFLEPVDWLLVQESILSTAEVEAEAGKEIQIQNFGPGYGALSSHKHIPASVRVKDVSTAPKAANEWNENDIAIVGMALDVPGAEEDPNRLWQNIMDGINTCSKIPENRFIIEDYHQDDKSNLGNPNRSMTTQTGSFLENPFLFDNEFFGISPREARSMDPQQRLLLQTAQRALEDSGYVPNATKTFDTASFGCYIGAATGDYAENLREEMDVYWVPGVLRSFLSGRISYAYGWGGPALTVDTACSSSIVAIWQAARALQVGDCNACIAGGVNVVTSPDMYIGLDRAHFLSPTGQCKSFDDPVDGYCRADGVACLVMKRMSDALAEKDQIHGVIRGIEVNQSGTAHSITHPHTPTQEILFKRVWRKNGIDPLSVSVVEAHGTGTGAGDPSEIHGITNSLCEGRTPNNPLNVGSIKANVGHSEAASGAVSLIKLLLMFKNQTIPPQTLFNKPNSNLAKVAKKGVIVNRKSKPWSTINGQPRLAMLNNFGGSGSNGSLIVQEYMPTDKDESAIRVEVRTEQLSYPFGCSAKNEKALLMMRDRIVTFLQDHGEDVALRDICYTSTARRQIYDYRLSTTASTVEELIENLQNPEVVLGVKSDGDRPATAVFVFSGQGSQYMGMSRELMEVYPAFEATVNECHKLLTKWGMPSCLDVILAETGTNYDLDDPKQQQAFQVAVFVLEVGIARLLISFGVTPRAVAGHSLGEYAALVCAGVLDLPSALKLVAHRAYLIVNNCSLKATGMLAVAQPAETLMKHLEQDFPDYSIACDNSPEDCVIGGPSDELESLKEYLQENFEAKSTILKVPVAYHTSAMDSVVAPLMEHIQGLKLSVPSIPVASNLLGRVVAAGEDAFQAEYFASHCRRTVKFQQSIKSLLSVEEGAAEGCWIEIGPHPVLLPMLSTIVPSKNAQFLSTLRKGTHPGVSMSQMLSRTYLTMGGLSWRHAFESMLGGDKLALTAIPGVPFIKQEFHVQYPREYVAEKYLDGVQETETRNETPYRFLSKIIKNPQQNPDGHGVFETPLSNLAEYIDGHTVCGFALCPASVYCELALSAAHFVKPGMAHTLSRVAIRSSLVYRKERSDSGIVLRINVNHVDHVREQLEFVVSSFDSKNNPDNVQVHSRGIIKSRPAGEIDPKYQKLAGLLKLRHNHYAEIDTSSIQIFSGPIIYDKIFSNTVNYSDMYRSIESIKIDTSANEAIASCKLLPVRDVDAFASDPILVDVLIHVPGFMANMSVPNGEFWICNKIKSATVLRDMDSDDGKFSIHCNNYLIEGGKTLHSDVQAYDSQGIFAVMKSIQFELVQMSDRTAAFEALAQRSKEEDFETKVANALTSCHPQLASATNTVAASSAVETRRSSTESSSSTNMLGSPASLVDTPLTSPEPSSPPNESVKPADLDPGPTENPPEQDIMAIITNIFVESCGTEKNKVQPDTNLETMGVDSLMVHEMRDEISKALNVDLAISDLTKCTTIRDAAALVENQDLMNQQTAHNSVMKTSTVQPAEPPPQVLITPELRNSIRRLLRLDEAVQLVVNPSKSSTSPRHHPLFFIHPGSGLTIEYQNIVSVQRALYAVSNPAFFDPGTWPSVQVMAINYARLISAAHKGPYLVGGWSFGGLVAVETARLLVASKGPQAVTGIVLVDTPPPMRDMDMSLPQITIDAAIRLAHSNKAYPEQNSSSSDVHQAIRELVTHNFRASSQMVRAYSVDTFQFPKTSRHPLPKLCVVRATEKFVVSGIELPHHPWLNTVANCSLALRGWEAVVGKGQVTVKNVPGHHFDMFSASKIVKTSQAIADACVELQQGFST